MKKLSNDYYLFQLSTFILSIGSRCNQLAVAWWALEKTNSAVMFASLIACAGFAEVISKPIFAWFGDQHNRRNILFLCNLFGAILSISLLICSILDYFYTPIICVLIVFFSIISGIRDPVHSSILPMLVDKTHVMKAVKLKNIISSVSLLIGPGLAGLLISIFGVSITLTLDLVSYLIACAMISLIKKDTNPIIDLSCYSFRGYIINWAIKTYDGFIAVFKIKTEFYLSIVAMIINFSLFPFFTILLPIFVKVDLKMDPWFVGVLDTCFGFGILLGSGVVVGIINNLLTRDLSVFIGLIFLGVSLFATGLFGFLDQIWVIPLFMLMGGIGLMLINVNTSVLRSLATPQAYRNRMAAMISFFSTCIGPIGAYTSGIFVESLGTIRTIEILGVTIFLASFIIFLIPQFKILMRLSEERMENAYTRIYPDAFK